MDKEEFLEFYKENAKQFIPGIHNYCDRWCERCAFTSKCGVYTMEQKREGEQVRDLENEKFWDQMSGIMNLTRELLEEVAEEQGIDLDSIDTKTIMEEEKKRQKKAGEHELATISEEYIDQNRKWFKENEETLQESEKEFQQKRDLNIDLEKTEQEFLKISDFIEVAQWYTFQIHVKIMRALIQDTNPEFEDPTQNDKNGSAKVALIGTERSISAWSSMLSCFEEQQDDILRFLAMLQKIREGIEKEFPDVRKFHRPGFDD